MKKEWIALFLLVFVLALCLWSIRTLDAVTADVCVAVAQAGEYADNAEWNSAEVCVRQALSRWLAGEALTRLLLRHSMLDAVPESLVAMQPAVMRRDAVEAAGAGRLAAERLRELAETERPTLGSVF